MSLLFSIAAALAGAALIALSLWLRARSSQCRVRVFYDPGKPASAVLDNRGHSDWGYWLLLGLGFCVLAFYLAAFRS